MLKSKLGESENEFTMYFDYKKVRIFFELGNEYMKKPVILVYRYNFLEGKSNVKT